MLCTLFVNRGGWRHAVLFHRGRKVLKLLDIGTFDIYEVPIRDERKIKPAKGAKATTRQIIRERRDSFNAYNFRFSKTAVKQALRVMQ